MQAGVTPQCSNSDIKVGNVGYQGAGGRIETYLTFTNVGASSCYMQGFPGAALEDASGTTVNATRTLKGLLDFSVSPSPGSKPLTAPPHVVLAPGRAVVAALEWLDVDPIGGVPNGCLMATSTALLVTPPNTTRTTKLTGLKFVCADFEVSPVLDETPPPTQ